MCVGPNRINEAMVTLSFDYNLVTKPDRTIIISPYSMEKFKPLFMQFSIDYDFITIISDEFFKQYYDLDIWFKDNWYKQQALKLCALDYFDSDYFLIQDCDLVLLEPYNILVDGNLNFKAEPLWNPYQTLYSDMVEKMLGYSRGISCSLVNEIMPYAKQDWIELKTLMEDKHKKDFLSAIASLHPFDETKWFSEYELLGIYKTNKKTGWQYFSRTSQPPVTTWEEFYSIDWHRYASVKFHARPLKFMSFDEAHRVVEFLKNVN